jgi:tetratricopeptide (TPR) repeat protein
VTLQHAKDLPNASPTILTDLATAYFQRAETEYHPTDYGTAAELLSAVLQRNPDDEIALFNRAIVYERLLLYEKAINDWERYLHVSRDEGWDGEAQEYLARLKQRLR